MATEVNKYRILCTTESDYVYTWDEIEPTVCPNDAGHTIDSSSITIIETISTNTFKAEENSDGYFETSMITVNVSSGTPGDIVEHDVSWPMTVLLWRTLLTPTADMIGDSISVLAAPETTVGVLAAPVSIGDTTFTVNSTVTDNVWRGFLITIDDTVNKDVVGRCTAVDALAGTISVETPTSFAFSPGIPVKISIYVMKDIYIADTNTIDIGTKGFKGKTVDIGTILRIYYTNNSGTAKTVRWRPEYYAKE